MLQPGLDPESAYSASTPRQRVYFRRSSASSTWYEYVTTYRLRLSSCRRPVSPPRASLVARSHVDLSPAMINCRRRRRPRRLCVLHGRWNSPCTTSNPPASVSGAARVASRPSSRLQQLLMSLTERRGRRAWERSEGDGGGNY